MLYYITSDLRCRLRFESYSQVTSRTYSIIKRLGLNLCILFASLVFDTYIIYQAHHKWLEDGHRQRLYILTSIDSRNMIYTFLSSGLMKAVLPVNLRQSVLFYVLVNGMATGSGSIRLAL